MVEQFQLLDDLIPELAEWRSLLCLVKNCKEFLWKKKPNKHTRMCKSITIKDKFVCYLNFSKVQRNIFKEVAICDLILGAVHHASPASVC